MSCLCTCGSSRSHTGPGPHDVLDELRGVCACGAGLAHTICCAVTVADQPHAMIDGLGQVFYPDGPDDAAWLAAEHGARFVDPTFTWGQAVACG